MQSIVGGSQPTVSRRPIKHESSGFSFLLHLLPNACQPTNLPVTSLALTIDLHRYSYHRVITSTSSDQRERLPLLSFLILMICVSILDRVKNRCEILLNCLDKDWD